MYFPVFWGIQSLFWCTLICVISSCAIFLEERAGYFDFIVFRKSYSCNVRWLFLVVAWADLLCVIVAFLIILTVLFILA